MPRCATREDSGGEVVNSEPPQPGLGDLLPTSSLYCSTSLRHIEQRVCFKPRQQDVTLS